MSQSLVTRGRKEKSNRKKPGKRYSPATALSLLAHSDPKLTAKYLAELALPPGMRRVVLYEVVHNGRSLHLTTEARVARVFVEQFNECMADDPATLVERPAVIAPIEQNGDAL